MSHKKGIPISIEFDRLGNAITASLSTLALTVAGYLDCMALPCVGSCQVVVLPRSFWYKVQCKQYILSYIYKHLGQKEINRVKGAFHVNDRGRKTIG